MEHSSFAAILLGLAAYSVFNIGSALQKKGASLLPGIHRTSFLGNLKNFSTNRIWLTGFFLTCLQWWLLSLALDFGSLSLVSPLRGAGIVVLAFFSRFYLREAIYTAERVGILLIIIGIAGIGICNVEETAEVGFSALHRLMLGRDSIVLFLILGAATVFPLFVSVKKDFRHADVVFGIAAGILLGLGVFFTKAVMAGVDMTALGPSLSDALKSLPWWLYVFAVVLFNTLSMVTRQVGFQHGRAIIVIPFFTITCILVPIVLGIVVLEEWAGYEGWQALGVVVSLIILSAGIIIMSVKPGPDKEPGNLPGQKHAT